MIVTKYKKVKLEHKLIEPEIKPCPLCGEKRLYKCDVTFNKGQVNTNTYGVEGIRHSWFRRPILLGLLYKYEKDEYKCHTCGAEWKSGIRKELILEKDEDEE